MKKAAMTTKECVVANVL